MEAKADFTTRFTNAIQGSKAIMMLYDGVGYDEKKGTGIRGGSFADEMYWHHSMGRSICVYINSPGGQVFDGFSIIQAILDTGATTHIVGMAASMAGVISQFGAYRTGNDFSIGMIHAASGGNEKLTELINSMLKDCLQKKSKLSNAQINKMMSTTEPTWLSAEDMLDLGLLDEVIITGMENDDKIKLKKSNAKILNVNESFKIYCDIVNSLENNHNLNTTEMDEIKAVGAELGLDNADKTAVINKIKEIKTAAAEKVSLQEKLNTSEAAKTAAESAKTTAENAFTTERKARATELVDNAILAGKIKEESKQSYIDLAVTNYDLAKTTLTGIQSGSSAHPSILNAAGSGLQPDAGAKDTQVEDYETLARDFPEKLREIAEKTPEKYDALLKEHTKKGNKTKQ